MRRFVLTVVLLNSQVLWDIRLCRLVNSDVTIDLVSLFFSGKHYTYLLDRRKYAESPKRRRLFTNRHTV